MIAVILAAGISSRLRPLTNSIPKSLLKVGGRALLERNLDTLVDQGIRRCVIVTGYLHDMLEDFVTSLNLPLDLRFVYNPVYARTNNNYSLWMASTAVQHEGILLLDADILYDARILGRLLASPYDDALIMRASHDLGHEEIKVRLDDEGRVLEIGKEVDPAKAAGESLGIERFSPATTERLFAVLGHRKEINEYYEASFQEVIDGGAKVHAVESGGYPCMEIDTPGDLTAAEALARRLP